jgi:glycosyltransferase involved in cell wall biosynthesis
VSSGERTTLPSVSAVIATRDRIDELRGAIAAIVGQEYDGDIEVVVVFDQSEPDESFASDAEHRTVRVIRNERTPGLPGARNSGILAASGDYVAFCDDDDRWRPGKLVTQIRLLESTPDAVAATSGIVVRYADHSVDRPAPLARIEYRDLLRDRITEAHPSTVICERDALLNKIGLVDEEIPGGYGEDYEWLMRAARDGGLVAATAPLTDVYWHAKSFFDSRWRTITEALTWLLERYPDFETEPRGAARIEGQIAFAYAALGQRKDSRDWARRALRHNPGEKRAYLAMAVALHLVSVERVVKALHARGKGI